MPEDNKQDLKDNTEDKMKEMIAESPIFRVEFLAFLTAISSKGSLSRDLNIAMSDDSTTSRLFAGSIATAIQTFASPVNSYIQKHTNDIGIGAAIARYFGYVWIDAIATSGVVAMTSAQRLRLSGTTPSYWNILYPLSVTLLGTPLKLLLSVTALVAAPVIALAAGITSIFSAEAAKSIAAPIPPMLGLIATVLISNLNPLILIKTLSYDMVKSGNLISKIKAAVKKNIKEPTVKAEDGIIANRNASSGQQKTPDPHKELAPEIVATFKIDNELRANSIVKNAKSVLVDRGFKVTVKSGSGLRKFFPTEPSVLEIHNQNGDKVNVVGIIHTQISENNNLKFKLQFTDNADADSKIRVANSFAIMVQGIAKTTNGTKINIDVSSFPNAADKIKGDIVDNILSLNKKVGVIPIEIKGQEETEAVDRKEHSSDYPELENESPPRRVVRPDDFKIV